VTQAQFRVSDFTDEALYNEIDDLERKYWATVESRTPSHYHLDPY